MPRGRATARRPRRPPARDSAGSPQLLEAVAAANPPGAPYLISDNLSRHKRPPVQGWLAANPRVRPAFIPVAACGLNVQGPWWRPCRRAARAGQTVAEGEGIDRATAVATKQLNARAKPWGWGRPQRPPRVLRHSSVYRI